MISYSPRSMLVTGGAGFIGSHFIHFCLERYPDLKIANLDVLSYAGSLQNLSTLSETKNYRFIQENICNKNALNRLLREFQIDTIVHFAAESHVDRSISNPTAFIESNIVGTFNLLETARLYWLEELKLELSQCRFHHISTDEVYGSLSKDDPAFTETTA